MDDVDITRADVIVSGGRGMMAKENFGMLRELAHELEARLRVPFAVDAGWMPRPPGRPDGKTVRPKITSPAAFPAPSSIWWGCRTRTSSSPQPRQDAPIFEVATYGIGGHLPVVPAMTQRIRDLKQDSDERQIAFAILAGLAVAAFAWPGAGVARSARQARDRFDRIRNASGRCCCSFRPEAVVAVPSGQPLRDLLVVPDPSAGQRRLFVSGVVRP